VTDLLSGLVTLDRLAARKGDGLKPALAALLQLPRAGESPAGRPSAAPVIDLASRRAGRSTPAPRALRAAP
jgi:hypothetical protein